MFSLDRDLLVFEPNLFRDIGFLSQRLIRTTGQIGAGGALTLDDGDLIAASVAPGHIALVNLLPVEILEVTAPTAASVSLIRVDPSASARPPSPSAAGVPVEIGSFDPQRGIVHRHLLAMLGIGDDRDDGPPLDESAILNPRDLCTLECLGTLHLIFAAAGAPVGGGGNSLWGRAEMYRARYEAERRRAVARIDLDNDGEPDATRALTTLRLIRA